MSSNMPTADRARLEELLAAVRNAWLERRYADLAPHFDERVVLVAPAYGMRMEGRDPLVESFREFMERSTIHEYRESDVAIDVWGDTAMAHYRWHVRWESGGTTKEETGAEALTLRRASAAPAGWVVVCRMVLPPPASTPPR